MSASSAVRAPKMALEAPYRARAEVARDNAMGRVTIRLGERAVLAGEVLHVQPVLSAARSALRKEISLSNVDADTCDHCIRHGSGRPRSAR